MEKKIHFINITINKICLFNIGIQTSICVLKIVESTENQRRIWKRSAQLIHQFYFDLKMHAQLLFNQLKCFNIIMYIARLCWVVD